MELVSLEWDTRALPLSLPLWGYNENMAVYQPGWRPSPEHDYTDTWILDFRSLRQWEINVYYLSYPVYSMLSWQPKLTKGRLYLPFRFWNNDARSYHLPLASNWWIIIKAPVHVGNNPYAQGTGGVFFFLSFGRILVPYLFVGAHLIVWGNESVLLSSFPEHTARWIINNLPAQIWGYSALGSL